MHRTIRISAVVCAVISLFLFASIVLFKLTIPDKINIVEGSNYANKSFLGINILNYKSEKNVNNNQNSESNQNDAEVMLFNIIPVKNVTITNSKRKYVVLGGDLFGIKLYTDGVVIVDIDDVETENGVKNPAKNAGIKIGDIIKSVDGVTVTSTSHFSKLLQESKGKKIKINLVRNGKKITVDFKTLKEAYTGMYRAGLWVRDSAAGLGTISFYNPENNSFGGLGHAIYDVDTNEIMPLKYGEMCQVTINGLYKSSKGNIGEISGILNSETVGTICINDETGVYGFSSYPKSGLIPVAVKQEVKLGKAQIVCTIDNKKEFYDIEITKIYSKPNSVNKDMIIKITDERLLNLTGGIVQGMSGSPIIQNDMLVGAVTHVFVNNPKQGYAILAEKMLETSTCQEMQKQEQLKKAS